MKISRKFLAATLLAAGLFSSSSWAQSTNTNPTPVQTFYVPLPEQQMLTALQELAPGLSGGQYYPTNPMTRYIGISVIGNGTIIYYDQHEKGSYETNISNPASIYNAATNPSGTQIWGDGNPTNGAPPGVPDDLLRGGQTIILSNNMTTPGQPTASSPRFDGGDKIASSKAIAITTTLWGDQSKTLQSDAAEVYDTFSWGTNFRTPVGTNIVIPGQSFQYVKAMIQAGPGGAEVQVRNANNTLQTSTNLVEGQTYYTTNNLVVGSRIYSDKPVQVNLITGMVATNTGTAFQSRWYPLMPTNLWTSSYYTPVSTPMSARGRGDTGENSSGTTVYLYNSGTSSINVSYATRSMTGATTDVQKYPNNNTTNTYTSGVWTNSAPGNVYGPLVSITNTNTTVPTAPEGAWIGIIPRAPTNNLSDRVAAARNAGAAALIVVNTNNSTSNLTNNLGTLTIPVVGVASNQNTSIRNTPLGTGWVRVSGNQVTNTVSVPAGGFTNQVVENGYGARFYSTNNSPFYAVSATDTTGTANTSNRTWDWGFTLVPQTQLTAQALVGLGFGRDPTSSERPNENGSPVWVSTVGNGNTNAIVYIDYDADPTTGAFTDPQGFKYDTSITLKELESVKVYNPSGNQSGMLLYSLDKNVKIVTAWGQDPLQATSGAPGFDGGTGVPPMPQFTARKKSALFVDVDGDGYMSPGDYIKYEVTIENVSRLPVDDVLLKDTLPASVNYIPNTTKFTPHNGPQVAIADNLSGNPFPLSGAGKTLGPPSSLPGQELWKVEYQVAIKAFGELPNGTISIINAATVNSQVVNDPVHLEEQQPLYGKIGDFVWNDINGNGIQDAGESGLNGATVNLLHTDGTPVLDVNGNPITTTTVTYSGSPGYYQLLGVPAGTYIVEFIPPSGYALTTQNADSQGVNGGVNSDPSPATGRTASFSMAAGQEKNTVDAGMYELGSISGTVLRDITGDNQGDVPMAGVTVTLKDSNNNTITTTTTDGSGNYSFGSLPLGDYRVVQTVPGGYTAVNDVDGGDFTVIGNVTPIHVAPATHVTGRDFVNQAPASITGTVFNDSNGNSQFDGGDGKISGVTIRLYTDPNGDGDPSDGVLVATTTTAGDGTYSFSNLSLGKYVVVEQDLYTHESVNDVQGSPTDNRVAVNVTQPATYAGKDFLDRAIPQSRFGSISGQVRNDADKDGDLTDSDSGLAGATIQLWTDPNGDGDPSDGVQVGSNYITTSNGNYSFTNLPPGKYVVKEIDPSGYLSTADVENPNDNMIPVTLPDNGNITGRNFLDAQESGGNWGTIGNYIWEDLNNNGRTNNGEPAIGGVVVWLYRSGQHYSTTTSDASGAYSFDYLPSGTYTVMIPALNFAPGGALEDIQASSSSTSSQNNRNHGVQSGGAGTEAVSYQSVTVNGSTNNNQDFGFRRLGAISGTVRADTTGDGTGDTGLAGVTITLKNTGGTTIATTTTAADGSYSFPNLETGSYRVEETVPGGYTAIGDVDGGNPAVIGNVTSINVTYGLKVTGRDFVVQQPGTISGSVLIDDDLDGTGDTPVDGVTLTLVDANGDPVLDGNNNPITTASAPDGSYSFSDLPPGTYGVKRGTPPTGYTGFADADGGDDVAWVGDVTDITLLPGETNANNDFLLRTQKCPPTWAEWQAKWTGLGAEDVTPTGNDDGDNLPNLLEYAFCLSPLSGGGTPYCMTPNVEAVDKADLTFRRTAGGPTDIIYEIEYAATLGENGTTWTTVPIPPANIVVLPQTDGSDRVRVTDLESITGLTAGTGFVRLKVSLLDGEGAVIAEATTGNDVGGWIATPLDLRIRSFNDPFLQCPIFTGTVSAVDGQDIVSAVSGGGIDYNAQVTAQPTYAEILTGPHQGQRFDIVAGGVNRFTTATDNNVYSGTPPFSTLAAPSEGIVGAMFVVRPHRTIGNVFPPRAFIATDDPETASMVQMYAGDRWNTYWLYNDGGGEGAVPGWIAVGDMQLNDCSGDAMPPGQGGFLYTRQENNPGVKFIISGKVRPNDFIRPLIAGWNNVGGGYPLVQSPFGRNMKMDTSNFYGDRNWAKADQFRLWRGDYYDGISDESYDSYFMVAGTASKPVDPDWFKTGDATYAKQNESSLFRPDYSIIISRKYANPDYRMPTPWKP